MTMTNKTVVIDTVIITTEQALKILLSWKKIVGKYFFAFRVNVSRVYE
jgi:hypothetical protein